jgi:hypothetical protein
MSGWISIAAFTSPLLTQLSLRELEEKRGLWKAAYRTQEDLPTAEMYWRFHVV